MIKTVEERKDISHIVDKWEAHIEDKLDQLWVGQHCLIFLLPSSITLTDQVTAALSERYKVANWWVWFTGGRCVSVGVKTLEMKRAEEKKYLKSQEDV